MGVMRCATCGGAESQWWSVGGRPAHAGAPRGTNQGVHSRHAQERFSVAHEPMVTSVPWHARTAAGRRGAGAVSRAFVFQRISIRFSLV
jgi:hypothetical protein